MGDGVNFTTMTQKEISPKKLTTAQHSVKADWSLQNF